jgi:hypothetical protein
MHIPLGYFQVTMCVTTARHTTAIVETCTHFGMDIRFYFCCSSGVVPQQTKSVNSTPQKQNAACLISKHAQVPNFSSLYAHNQSYTGQHHAWLRNCFHVHSSSASFPCTQICSVHARTGATNRDNKYAARHVCTTVCHSQYLDQCRLERRRVLRLKLRSK